MVKKLFSALALMLAYGFSQELDSLKNSKLLAGPQESKVVAINANVVLGEYKPSAFKISIFPRNSPSEVFISRMFFPGDTIQIILPEDILNPDTLGNIASLEPIGGSYEKIYRLFSKSSESIDLGSFKVEAKSDIIKLSIIDGISLSPVSMAGLKLLHDGKIIFSGNADSMGYKRLRIPEARDNLKPISLRIETSESYPAWQEIIEVPKGISSKTISLYQLHTNKGESLYRVINDLTPFRKGPENGSETLFLLNIGDLIAVSKVAGDRMYGTVRIDLYDKRSFNYFQGWVLSKHTILVHNNISVKTLEQVDE